MQLNHEKSIEILQATANSFRNSLSQAQFKTAIEFRSSERNNIFDLPLMR